MGKAKKDFALSDDIVKMLDLIFSFKYLKERGEIQNFYNLQPIPIQTQSQIIVYVISPKMEHIKLIASQINNMKQVGQKLQYYIIFIPNRDESCIKILEENGVYGDVNIIDFELGLIRILNCHEILRLKKKKN